MIPLLDAVSAVLRDALDNVRVHPCDEKDDAVRAQRLCGPMADLYAAMHPQQADGELWPAPVVSGEQVSRAIAKSKAMLLLVDACIDNHTASARAALRVALMDEFMGLVPVAVVRNGLNGMRAEIQAEGRAPRLKEGQQLYAMAGEVRA